MASPFPVDERDPGLSPLLSDITYTRGLLMPPIKFPTPVHVILSPATSAIVHTRPYMTFSENWVNHTFFFRMDMTQTYPSCPLSKVFKIEPSWFSEPTFDATVTKTWANMSYNLELKLLKLADTLTILAGQKNNFLKGKKNAPRPV